ncbi:hypothetical protein ACFPER_17285 [Agromyces aurantiacus]|uniref:Lytic transglycosylase domain-containing protein n=1 Tax=Agromyces aurantiacus TaxID=165814 RepID=A0ABV9R8P6_9MICO|nr:hypothetical protein [Agromyces aurantiacus]MBM7504553.1 hypothetical protein [Agromyces aurantiacus]
MRNLKSSPSTTETLEPRPLDAKRVEVRRARRNRRTLIASGAVVAVGALVGSGFAVQSAVADQHLRVAQTAALTEGTDRGIDQLDAHGGILEAKAVKQAEDTIAVASDTIAAAKGKADAGELASTVASLEDYTYLAPERVFALVDAATEHADEVKAEIKEFDRKAAEKAAAEKAAAEKAAAEKAAAEAAAAAEQAPASPSYPTGPANPSGAQAIARDLMASLYGWGDDQFGCLVDLWNKESGWNVYAQNPSSGAYGIPQALPGDKMATAGADWASNPATQITWGLGYIAGRYGTPCGAWSHSASVGWY